MTEQWVRNWHILRTENLLFLGKMPGFKKIGTPGSFDTVKDT